MFWNALRRRHYSEEHWKILECTFVRRTDVSRAIRITRERQSVMSRNWSWLSTRDAICKHDSGDRVTARTKLYYYLLHAILATRNYGVSTFVIAADNPSFDCCHVTDATLRLFLHGKTSSYAAREMSQIIIIDAAQSGNKHISHRVLISIITYPFFPLRTNDRTEARFSLLVGQ